MADAGSSATGRWRGARLAAAWIAVTAVCAAAPWWLPAAQSRQMVLIAILGLVVSGLNLSFGHAGELSFAQPVMYALGAYVTAHLALNHVNDVLAALAVSAAAGLALGLVTGIPGLRLGGWMLAISSLFLVLLVPDVVSALEKWTGGRQGLGGVPAPMLLGRELGQEEFAAVVVLVTSAWFVLYRNLVVSRAGTSLAVLRESPVLAASLGIGVYTTKLKTYAVSGIPAAAAGSLFAYLDGYVAPESFGVTVAISILAASILGGARSVYGVFVGVALMVVGPMQTSAFGDYAYIFYGLFLVVAGVALRQGIAGLAEDVRARLRRSTTVPATSGGAREAALPPIDGRRLSVREVSRSFGGVVALKEVTFTVEPGEVVALIGPNGSGKTTLLNVVCGYYRPDAGAVSIGGREVTGQAPHRIARRGVARTFQTPSVPALSVREAVAVARTRVAPVSMVETMLRAGRFRRVARADRRAVDELLAAVGLAHVTDTPARSLPLGTRRLLELARALAARPSVLLLDEVASGLDDDEIGALDTIIRRIRDSGGSVLLVEHNFALVRSLADRVVVLARGEVVLVDTPEAVARHPEVLEHYLGGPAATDAAYREDVHG